jgi:hypothetical protein
MGTKDRIFGLIAPPAIVGLVAVAASVLPMEILDFLSAWIFLSCPIGIVIGHFALGED